jgi:hypothetical protein
VSRVAQKNATMLVVGNVVKSQRIQGDFKDRESGDKIEYDYILAKVLTPEVDVIEVRFPSNGSVPLPHPDEVVTIRCDVRGAGGNIKVMAEAVSSQVAAAK